MGGIQVEHRAIRMLAAATHHDTDMINCFFEAGAFCGFALAWVTKDVRSVTAPGIHSILPCLLLPCYSGYRYYLGTKKQKEEAARSEIQGDLTEKLSVDVVVEPL